ncbi:MAG: hypothetical protein QM766_23550 [Burkholderiaceae bacterium]
MTHAIRMVRSMRASASFERHERLFARPDPCTRLLDDLVMTGKRACPATGAPFRGRCRIDGSR